MVEEHDEASAFLAECCALFMAAPASMIAFPACDLTVVSDCSSALGCAAGVMSTGSMKVQGILRALHVLRPASSQGVVHYVHTHTHKGEFANEVVDVASKLAAKGQSLGHLPFQDASFWCHARGQRLLWAATACRSLRGSISMPSVFGQWLGEDSDLRGWSAEQVLAPFVAMPWQHQDVAKQHPAALISLRFVCYADSQALATRCEPDGTGSPCGSHPGEPM